MTFALFLLGCCAVLRAESDWEFIGLDKTRILDTVRDIPATFYVSPEGNDEWSGKTAEPNNGDGPFQSLERAQKAVREYRASGDFDGKPTVVEVQAGIYELEKPLTFEHSDSGTAESPVIWRGVCDREDGNAPLAILRGGRNLTGAKPVTDPAILKRIKPEVRDKIIAFDLKALGIEDYGTLNGEHTAELFLNDQPMTISRYPNEGFITFEKVDEEGNKEVDIRGTKGVKFPKIYIEDYDVTPWLNEPEIWALGYWFWDWANQRQKIVKLDADRKLFELDKPYHAYGYRPGQYYFVYHLLCELDQPGEYYIDNESGILYFYPPEPVTDDNVFFSILSGDVTGTSVDHFVFCGFQLDGCRQTALSFTGSDNIICGCLVRNVGGNGINVGGDKNVIFGNHLYNIGAQAVSISSGDWKHLKSGGAAAINNDIHDYGRIQRVYASGIGFHGCGILMSQNRITDAPHCGTLFSGVDNRIERNEYAHVCEETNDAGAVYCGRDWTQRGNLIKNNYLHDITGFEGKGCVGVYLDDMFSSADVVGNLFVNVTRAILLGGGRDNSVVNNIFIECHPTLHVDARALGWCNEHADYWIKEATEHGTISGIDYKSEPWSTKFPKLSTIMDGTPKAPEGNLISRNVVIRNSWNRNLPDTFEGDAVEEAARPYITLTDNFIGDYRLLLSLDSGMVTPQISAKIPFERIPVERIGRFDHTAATARK